MDITVRYFAQMREEAGKDSEVCSTQARTPQELFAELSGRYAFTLSLDEIRVAVNEEFSQLDAPLQDGDEVVFIPPVAGG